MIHIDTLAFVRRLTAAGFERAQAEALVEGIAAADTSQVASRADIAELKAATANDIAGLKAATKHDIATLKGELKSGIAELEIRLTRHMLVQTGVIVGAVVALMKLLP